MPKRNKQGSGTQGSQKKSASIKNSQQTVKKKDQMQGPKSKKNPITKVDPQSPSRNTRLQTKGNLNDAPTKKTSNKKQQMDLRIMQKKENRQEP